MQRKPLFMFLLLMLPFCVFAQQIRNGKIIDAETQTGIPGASVKIAGKNKGVITTSDGSFNIKVMPNDLLEISSLGYAPETVSVNANTDSIIIILNPTQKQAGGEVVVVGYGTQKKVDITGSVTQIKGEEISRMPNTNPLSSLQGKVPGLTISNSGSPGSAPVVRIRGVNSTNSATPLYVVDGVLHDNIDFLSQADIETIDVLRDASSVAIYGLRGANGVIAITTKKAARGKTLVNVQSSVGMNKIVNRIKLTDAAGFRKLYDQELANLNAKAFDYSNYTANTDWQDLIIQNGIQTNQSISISNSGEKTTSLLSLGYNKTEGVIKYGDYERFTARLNQEIRISQNVKIGGDLAASLWQLNPTNVSLTNALWAAPIVPVQSGDMYYSMPSFQRAQVLNPIATMDRLQNTSINRGHRFVGSIFAEIKFLNDFAWRSTLYTDLGFNNNRSYSPLPAKFIDLGENGGKTNISYNDRLFTGISQGQSEYRKFQQDHTLSWNKNIDNHRINAIAGFTTVYDDNTGLSAYRKDTMVNVPNHPDFWYLGIINENNPSSVGGSGSKNALAGLFGRVSYAYQNKYLVNATVRRDGSSKFAPKLRWGTFGSIGAGWVISQEDFFKSVRGIDFLKLRASYGKLGNSNGVGSNLYQPGLRNASTAVFGDNVYTALQAAYIPDPNLHWEVVRGIDLGVEFRALNNRLNGEFTLYDRTTSDILTSLEIPNDDRKYFTNLGKITNKGIEASLGWSETLSNGFSYGINGNFSYNKNVVNSIGDKINFEITGNKGANRTITGYSIGHFYGYEQIGIYQSTVQMQHLPYFANSSPGDIIYRDVDGNDTINSADRTYLGTPFPPYSFALNINLGYKGFDLLIEGQGVAGNKIYAQRRKQDFAVLNYEANRLNAWTGPGTSNIEPILDNSRGNNYLFSSYYLEPGDYFRLRTVQLGYNFTTNYLSKIHIKNARVFVSGQNMKTWTKVTGYSPEAQIGSIIAGGADNGVYPIPATYTLGLNLTF